MTTKLGRTAIGPDACARGCSRGEVAVYDSQDRLTTLGGVAYSFSDTGALNQRGTDTFKYSARGELLSATVGANTIIYAYDAMGRRVARTVGSAAAYQYFYGNPSNALQLSAARSPAGVLSVFHYDEAGRLFATQLFGFSIVVGASW